MQKETPKSAKEHVFFTTTVSSWGDAPLSLFHYINFNTCSSSGRKTFKIIFLIRGKTTSHYLNMDRCKMTQGGNAFKRKKTQADTHTEMP